MSIDQENAGYSPWYKKTWGVLLLVAGIVVAGVLGYVGILTIRFYRDIQLGIPPEIQRRVTSSHLQAPKELKESLAYRVDNDPTLGNPNAPLQIVEFADFECPYSRDESFVIRELTARYPNKIHFVYRDFPLDDIHPHARVAAQAGACAERQGKFWALHDKMFQNADRLGELDIKTYALESGLDMVKFNQCFDEGQTKEEVQIDRADGVAAGVQGTPTFFINGKRVAGAIPMGLWEEIVGRAR